MIDSPDLQSLARELGVRIVGPLTGGEFGAMLAVDGAGREFVLKVMSPPAVLTVDRLATLFRRGAVLAGRARAIGYPAPEYLGTGKTDSFAWSLQERLPGTVPDVMTPAHARRLVELATMHRDIAGESYDWRRFAVDRMREHLQTVVQDQRAVPLAHELAAVMERSECVEIRQHDVVHADFHHRNYLATDDEVTGRSKLTPTRWYAVPTTHRDTVRRLSPRSHECAMREGDLDALAIESAFQATSHLPHDVLLFDRLGDAKDADLHAGISELFDPEYRRRLDDLTRPIGIVSHLLANFIDDAEYAFHVFPVGHTDEHIGARPGARKV